ncbi:DNA-binding transcriptional LysR family regulator [Paucibacter oligotrophus]|uniref:DNA-binding transcriptional LysR family regulator n=1 Tax=Roseateles oligotrophus TaxID=1769250 RepID=A0A840L553_9BURK|nr:LysR family transcriptional regulator [Roseateles oligotrophus]MBB4841665.1 DNA-binding transcriptional LysR family regulator [Roseateles oligotrophus]
MIELRSLRQFLALAEELHFGRAAARLHMTQPPLTQAIQKLEVALGVSLFERSSRSVALSPAGEALLPQARQMLAQAQGLPALVQAAAKGESGRLRLGFVSTVGYGELPRWLREFRERFPAIALSLREATLDVQLPDFASGELDLGFIIHAPGACPPGFERLRIASEPMVLALSSELALAKQASLRAEQVLPLPLVIFPRAIAPSLFDAVLGFYQAQGASPRIEQEAIQMQTIVNLVSAGMGAAWVPASVQALVRVGVSYKPVLGGPPSCETSLIWPQDAAPTVRRFVEHIASRISG